MSKNMVFWSLLACLEEAFPGFVGITWRHSDSRLDNFRVLVTPSSYHVILVSGGLIIASGVVIMASGDIIIAYARLNA